MTPHEIPQSEEELSSIAKEYMTEKQQVASEIRERAHDVYGAEMPKLEWEGDSSHGGVIRGEVKGVSLELRKRNVASMAIKEGTQSKDEFEYSGTINGRQVEPTESQRLFDLYAFSPSKEFLKAVEEEARKSTTRSNS